MQVDVSAAFSEGDIPLSIQAINRHFGAKNYSLWHLFKHEQQTILDQIFDSTMQELESSFRQIYDDHFSLIRMINENHLPLPKALANVVEFVLLRDLTKLLSMNEVPLDRLGRLVKEINRWQFKRDKEQLDFLGAKKMNALMSRFSKNTDDVALLEYIVEIIKQLKALRLDMEIWKAQNIYYTIGQEVYRRRLAVLEKDGEDRRWLEAFEQLGEILKVKIV
jgi:hypothetical protein